MYTISNAYTDWYENIRPLVIEAYSAADRPALAESWNNYTDQLCKEGSLTELQYEHCPAFDDDMPGDEDAEREWLLDMMGVDMAADAVYERPDDAGFPCGSYHWSVTLTRGKHSIQTYYSKGPGLSATLEVAEVLASLLMDTSEDVLNMTFEEWAYTLGFDEDSRSAERIFKACQGVAEALNKMFGESDLEDLRELFEDF